MRGAGKEANDKPSRGGGREFDRGGLFAAIGGLVERIEGATEEFDGGRGGGLEENEKFDAVGAAGVGVGILHGAVEQAVAERDGGETGRKRVNEFGVGVRAPTIVGKVARR